MALTQRRFPYLPEVKSCGLRSGEHTTSSTCLYQGVPCTVASTRRPASDCCSRCSAHALFDEARWKTMPFTIAVPTMVPGLLTVLVDAHIRIEICLTCRSSVGPDHPIWTVLRGSLVIPAEEFLVRKHHPAATTSSDNTKQRRNDHNRDDGRPRRGEKKRRGDREEVKKREGGERGEMMKIMYPENTKKKAVASGKSAFYMLKVYQTQRFPFLKKRSNCVTPVSVFFCNFFDKRRPFQV